MRIFRAFGAVGNLAQHRGVGGLALLLILSTRPAGRTAEAATRVVQVGPGGTLTFQDTVSGTSTTTITAGDTVQWDWLTGFHSTTRAAGLEMWDSGQHPPPFSFARVFAIPGSYSYLCTVHGAIMSGSIVVQQPSTPTPTTTPPAASPTPTAISGPGTPVPTASPWSLGVFAAALLGVGFFLLRRNA